MSCVDPVVFVARRLAGLRLRALCAAMARLYLINGSATKCVGKKMFEQAAYASDAILKQFICLREACIHFIFRCLSFNLYLCSIDAMYCASEWLLRFVVASRRMLQYV